MLYAFTINSVRCRCIEYCVFPLQDLEEEIQKNSQILADNQNLNAQLKLKDTEIVQVCDCVFITLRQCACGYVELCAIAVMTLSHWLEFSTSGLRL